MQEHGGDLGLALKRFGGRLDDWVDLSTGINRQPYPVPDIEPHAWRSLPAQSELQALLDTARQAYRTTAPALAMAGVQAAIQCLPAFARGGRTRIFGPTYNEFGAVLSASGCDVLEVSSLDALAGADLAIIVNPNNPDGRRQDKAELLGLLPKVGRLVVDESFADGMPDVSVAAQAGQGCLLVLRSFGKFYGLAGLRLGFVLGAEADIANFAVMAGPWPVSGPAIALGRLALADREWAKVTAARLERDCGRLDEIAKSVGWRLIGGTLLFRLFQVGDALAIQEKLARRQIWSRVFANQPGWLRLGLPGDETEWTRLEDALTR